MNRPICLRLEPLHARITPVAGVLDTTFGANGIVTQQIPGYYRTGGESVLVQPDGKIIVAGLANDFSNNHPAVFRYNTDGTPDTQFSGDGFAILDIPGGAAGCTPPSCSRMARSSLVAPQLSLATIKSWSSA